MNNVTISEWHCSKCNIILGNIREDADGDRVFLDEVGGKVKLEIRIVDGYVKRWCSRCNTINMMRPVTKVKLRMMT